MSAKKKEESEPEPVSNSKSLETFIGNYMESYRDYLSSREMDAMHMPQFYKGFPYSIEIHSLPNRAVCVLFKKGARSKLTAMDSDFEAVMARARAQDFDFLEIFPPFTRFTPEEASRLAKLDADKDLKASRRLEMLAAAEAHLSEIHTDIQAVVELNPWLDQQSEEQRKKLDKAKGLIKELYSEVDISREERFSDYSRQLSEVMAFEKGDMEEVASEITLEMETALEEMDGRIASLETAVKDNPVKPDSIIVLEESIAELTRNMRDAMAKIKTIERSGAMGDLDDTISEFRDILKENSKTISNLNKEFEAVKNDVALSQEIKETVFRDSKRTFNLNERVTELERLLASMKSESGKSPKSDYKALEGRMNVMENDLKDYIRNYVDSEVASKQEPLHLRTTEPEITVTPSGTIKKTTRTTTRKRTRSK